MRTSFDWPKLQAGIRKSSSAARRGSILITGIAVFQACTAPPSPQGSRAFVDSVNINTFIGWPYIMAHII
ncbi:hypothetical protein VTN96DRAFT_9831 [Rasamsonia emersonii]